MKYIYYLLTISLISLFPCSLYAQYDGTIPKVNPVTPNSASLFKNTGKPMGSFTGTTPIEIPLYTVSSGNLKVPINLSYSNGGIRVEEIASWVGLGWNLSLGGRITRSMNGTPDDDPSRGMLYATVKPSTFPANDIVANATYVITGQLDVEPDNFYFDCNGMSGKFFFDEDKTVRLVSQQAIDIKPLYTDGLIRAWVITDVKGNKYYFGKNKATNVSATEITSLSYDGTGSVPGPQPAYISSWHLMEIRDMNDQNVITFSYTQNSTTFKSRVGESFALSGVLGVDCTPSEFFGQEMDVITQTQEFYLNSIVGGIDSLVFNSSGNRKDFSGGRRLDAVAHYSRANQLIKSHHFNYSYFSQAWALNDPINDLNYKRLKLGKLSEFGVTSTDSLTHTFDYIEDVNLPARLDRGIDYWGYFNGAQNSTLIPNGVYRDGTSTYMIEGLADRRANPLNSIANTLKKITFPTKGSREFEYEGNQALLDYYDTQINPDIGQYVYKGFNLTNFEFSNPYLPIASKEFTIAGPDGLATFKWAITESSCPTNNIEVKLYQVREGEPDLEIRTWSGQYAEQYTLDNGDYRIEVYQSSGCVPSSLTGTWYERIMPPSTTRYAGIYIARNNNVGGIRVSQIKDYDPISAAYTTTKYQYSLFANPTLTSGMLVSPVRVLHEGGCTMPNRSCQYIRLSSNSVYPLATQSGSYVVYPEVKTYEEGNGYNERTFAFEYDVYPSTIFMHDFPVVPAKDNSWARGQMILERNYTLTGTKISENSSKGNEAPEYDIDRLYVSQIGHKVVGYYSSNVCPNSGFTGMVCSACYGSYTVGSQFVGVRVQKNRIYTSQNYIEQLTEYDYYTNLGRTLLKEERVYLGDGSIKKTKYNYAFNNVSDFVFGLTSNEQLIKNDLLAKNYLEPIEISTTVFLPNWTSVLVQGVKLSFGIFNGTAHHLTNVKQYSSLTAYKETILSNYDLKGNLIEKYEAGSKP